MINLQNVVINEGGSDHLFVTYTSAAEEQHVQHKQTHQMLLVPTTITVNSLQIHSGNQQFSHCSIQQFN